MKWLLLISILVAVPGILVYFRLKNSNKEKSFWSKKSSPDWIGVSWFISGLLVFFVCLFWVVIYTSSLSNIEVYHATKYTIENARQNDISEMERAALTVKIIEINEVLADARFINRTFVGDVMPDALAELEYLK